MKMQKSNSDSALSSYNIIKQCDYDCANCEYLELFDDKHNYKNKFCDDHQSNNNIKILINFIFSASLLIFSVTTLFTLIYGPCHITKFIFDSFSLFPQFQNYLFVIILVEYVYIIWNIITIMNYATMAHKKIFHLLRYPFTPKLSDKEVELTYLCLE